MEFENGPQERLDRAIIHSTTTIQPSVLTPFSIPLLLFSAGHGCRSPVLLPQGFSQTPVSLSPVEGSVSRICTQLTSVSSRRIQGCALPCWAQTAHKVLLSHSAREIPAANVLPLSSTQGGGWTVWLPSPAPFNGFHPPRTRARPHWCPRPCPSPSLVPHVPRSLSWSHRTAREHIPLAGSGPCLPACCLEVQLSYFLRSFFVFSCGSSGI
jgi:hypothetical protein